MGKLLRPVHDATTVDAFKRAYVPLIESGHLSRKVLAARAWIAVPVESGCHFTPADAERMAHAMREDGLETCIAMLTETLVGIEPMVAVPTTVEGLLEFSWLYGHFGWVLGATSPTWAVLCTVEDYYVIAGPKSFVMRALGESVDAGRTAFARFAEQSGNPMLREVAAWYRAVNG